MQKRRNSTGIAIVAALAIGGTIVAARAANDVLVVDIDRAKVIRLPAGTRTVIVGNPTVADIKRVPEQKDVFVVVGKGFGETNLVVLDATGNSLTEETILVKANARSTVIVQRGTERESYSCAPRCEPTVQLSDGVGYLKGSKERIDTRNSLATPSGQP